MDYQDIKIAIVGDPRIGIKSMINAYCASNPSRILGQSSHLGSKDTYVQVLYKHYRLTLICCEILEGKEHEERKAICYKGAEIILVCFSLASLKSLIHVMNKWYPEADHYCPCTTKFIVGTMLDLRRNHQVKDCIAMTSDIVTSELGHNLARHFSADGYFECSSISGEGLNDLFHHIIDFVMQKRQVKSRPKMCHLL